jgi:hypothetical protein
MELQPVTRGYLADGRFCTLRCGWEWANYMADQQAGAGCERMERWQSDNPYPNPDLQPKTGDDS